MKIQNLSYAKKGVNVRNKKSGITGITISKITSSKTLDFVEVKTSEGNAICEIKDLEIIE